TFISFVIDGVDDSSVKPAKFNLSYSDWGGYVPTVVTKSDTLPNGLSIRFPLTETAVSVDQRGVSRLPETCMGAYELGCVNDTTFTTDTIYVGDKILGQTFTKVGVHDSIFETLKSSLDCDSVVMHRVVVKPDPKTFNYYVKMDKEGRGDGSDWDNAMDSTDFATYLPLAPDGATFYVAAGTYKPVYGVNLNVPSKTSDLCYAINSSVTIRGGYPADAKGKDVPSEPKKYETIFDGDVNRDDVVDETLDKDGYPILERTKGEDNVKEMFLSLKQDDQNLTFDGIVVKNVTWEAINIVYSHKDVTLSNDSFVYNNIVFQMPSEDCSLNVSYTSFSKNTGRSIFVPSNTGFGVKNIKLNYVNFYSNIGDMLYTTRSAENMGSVDISNVIAKNNKGQFYIQRHHVNISNSIIEKCANLNSIFNIIGMGKDDYYNGIVNVSNSKFIANNGGYIFDVQIANTFNVDSCIFNGNKCEGRYLLNFYSGPEANDEYFIIKNSQFISNSTGGFVTSTQDSVYISNNEIANNKSFSSNFLYSYCELSNNKVHDNESIDFYFVSASGV
ncbi:MAG: hypothetical protein UE068_10825, partial [Paludibacteraceae bacterium]|nr:hypothetical protein [Paludibacteraceae bacterium]